MKLKGKIRDYKIRKFIEKNKEKLNFTEEELNFLYNLKSVDFISKLNRMNSEQKEYILSPLKYTSNKMMEEYGIKEINSQQIYKIIKSQLEVVLFNNEDIKNPPDLTKLYIALNLTERNDYYIQNLYNYLVKNYIYCCKIKLDSTKNDIFDYINVFTNNIEEWPKLLKISNDIRDTTIYNLSPSRLEDIALYKVDKESQDKKSHIISHLIFLEKEELEKINSLTSEEFIRILNLLIKNFSIMNKGQLNLALTSLSFNNNSLYVDDRKINILENLSPEIYELLSKLVFMYENNEIVEKIYEDNEGKLVKALSNTPKECLPYTEEILIDEAFLEIPTISLQKEILEKLGKLGKDNSNRYYELMSFLFGNDEEPGFLYYLDSDCIPTTLDFICTNESKEVLKAKFNALEIIRNQIFSILNDTNKTYEKYVKYLNYGLDEKEFDEDKINQIEIRSDYFEKESFYTTFKDIERNKNKKEILNLLYETKNLEQMNAIYRVIHISSYYDNEVQKLIIERLKSTETGYASTQIVNYIVSPEFLEARKEEQKLYLKSLKLAGEKTFLSVKGFTIDIPDYQYLKKFMIENEGSLTFINKETGKEITLMMPESEKTYKKVINHNKKA